jgi:hypothetical protein
VVLSPEHHRSPPVDLAVGQEEGEAAAGPAPPAPIQPALAVVAVHWVPALGRVPRVPRAVISVHSVRRGGDSCERELIDLVSQLRRESEKVEDSHGGRYIDFLEMKVCDLGTK